MQYHYWRGLCLTKLCTIKVINPILKCFLFNQKIQLSSAIIKDPYLSFLPPPPSSGELWTQIKVTSGENTELKVLPLKPGVGQYIAIHATLTASNFFLVYFYPSGPFICIFSKTCPDFSCVGCANTRFLCRPIE